MIPLHKDDGLGANDRAPGWFYGSERVSQIQGLFYVPSLKRFVGEDGALYPFTFDQPGAVFQPSDQPWAIVSTSPWDFPSADTVKAVQGMVVQWIGSVLLSVEHIADPQTMRSYFLIRNKEILTSSTHSVGQIARAIMVSGPASAKVALCAELTIAGVLA